MAFGSASKELNIVNELLRDQIKDLKEEKVLLQKQIERLQEALMAKNSPEAYRSLKDDQLAEMDSPIAENDPKEKERKRIENQWLQKLEDPLFIDAEDMIDTLLRRNGPPETKSPHDNSES